MSLKKEKLIAWLVATEQSTVKTSQYLLNKEKLIIYICFARTEEKKEPAIIPNNIWVFLVFEWSLQKKGAQYTSSYDDTCQIQD